MQTRRLLAGKRNIAARDTSRAWKFFSGFNLASVCPKVIYEAANLITKVSDMCSEIQEYPEQWVTQVSGMCSVIQEKYRMQNTTSMAMGDPKHQIQNVDLAVDGELPHFRMYIMNTKSS